MIESIENYIKQSGRNVQILKGNHVLLAHIDTKANWGDTQITLEDPVWAAFNLTEEGFHLSAYRFSEFSAERKFTISTKDFTGMFDISPAAAKAYAAIRAYIYDSSPDGFNNYFEGYAKLYNDRIVTESKAKKNMDNTVYSELLNKVDISKLN